MFRCSGIFEGNSDLKIEEIELKFELHFRHIAELLAYFDVAGLTANR